MVDKNTAVMASTTPTHSAFKDNTKDTRKKDDRKKPKKKEFVTRLISSLAFIPIVLILGFGSLEVVGALCAIAFAFIGYEIFSPRIKGHILLRSLMLIFCAVGIFCFVYFRKYYGAPLCIFLICVASLTDTGAYCVGKLLKGPKLCPKISPMKTWAGFFGGFLLTNVCYYLFAFSSAYKKIPALEIISFFLLQGFILSAVLGDLIESAFKRKIGVKDMGNLFPGHGGLLDRLDSLIGVSIVAFLFNYIWGIIQVS